MMGDENIGGMTGRTWVTWAVLGLVLSAAVVVLGDASMLARQVLFFAAAALFLPVWVASLREGATRTVRWVRRHSDPDERGATDDV